MSKPEIDPGLITLAFEGHLPYGTHVEGAVERMNEEASGFMAETVALSHFYKAVGKGDRIRKFAFPQDGVVLGEFRGFELTEEGLHMPVGIRMNIDLVPGSSPGVHREEVVPLWVENTKAFRIPNFDYQRPGGSILETLQRHVKIKL